MDFTMNVKRRSGFTLVEMIIVIVIICILAAIAIPNVASYLRQGRVAKAVSDAASLAAAINVLNTTLSEPYQSETDLTSDLKQKLIDANLLPSLTADFESALKNVVWDDEVKLFDGKKPPYGDEDLLGY